MKARESKRKEGKSQRGKVVLLNGFETFCTHTLCKKGLVLTTKVKISSEPLVFD